MFEVDEYLAKHKELSNYDYHKVRSLRYLDEYDPEEQGIPKQYIVTFMCHFDSGDAWTGLLGTTDSLREAEALFNKELERRYNETIEIQMYGDYKYEVIKSDCRIEYDPNSGFPIGGPYY